MGSRGETFWFELASGFGSIGWGAYVYLDTEPLSALPAYDLLSAYVPDNAWCGIAVAFGLVQVAAGLSVLRWPDAARWPRFAAAWLLLLWWKVLAVSLFNSGSSAPAAMVYCDIALFNMPTIVLIVLSVLRRRARSCA